MEQSLFAQLSLVIVVAAAVSLLMRFLRQPLIMGYILTGILVGPSVFHLITDIELFDTFAEVGIALLLFIIGLGLNVSIIRSLGKPVLATAFTIAIGIGAIGLISANAFDFSNTEVIIMATALLFSSTIIVIKSISDKREQTRLYAQIAIGVLLVEDIVATLALLFVTTAAGSFSPSEFAWLGLKGVGLAAFLFISGGIVLPRLTKLFAQDQEILFLFALGWGLGIASLFYAAGFSVEVGALFAGVSLASLPFAQEIGARLKPLRDFFVVLFFIVLGESLTFDNLRAALVPALVFSALVLIFKPLIIMATLGLQGYTKLTSFKSAVHLSQISEFSIVLVVLAFQLGLVSEVLAAVVTLTAVITIAISAYLMKYDDQIFRLLETRLQLFERKVTKKEHLHTTFPIILFGYRKGGHEFVKTFREMKKRYVVVDYDPEVIEQMDRQGIRYAYGDATDLELLEEIGVAKAQLIVSTITHLPTNQSLLHYTKKHASKTSFICHADNYADAATLYSEGATYVIMPHFIGSERISGFMKKHGISHHAFTNYREKHLLNIGKIASR